MRPARYSDGEESYRSSEQKFGNLKWTKIIKIGEDLHHLISLFDLQDDWDYFVECPPKPLKKKIQKWELLFDPKKLEKEEPNQTMEQCTTVDPTYRPETAPVEGVEGDFDSLHANIRGKHCNYDRHEQPFEWKYECLAV